MITHYIDIYNEDVYKSLTIIQIAASTPGRGKDGLLWWQQLQMVNK